MNRFGSLLVCVCINEEDGRRWRVLSGSVKAGPEARGL